MKQTAALPPVAPPVAPPTGRRARFALVRIDTGEKIARRLSLDAARSQARDWNSTHPAPEWVAIDPPVSPEGGTP